MFREMMRKKQALSLEECKEILKTETRGVLSVMGENGYPYGMPMNHFYPRPAAKRNAATANRLSLPVD